MTLFIDHALGLHLHQPPGNLRLLLDTDPQQAEAIIRCYERVVRYALQYRDVARLHVGFSGILLEQFLDPDLINRCRQIVDIPAMIECYREAENIELIGTGYYHPLLSVIPHADWPEQLERGRNIIERVFGRAPRGFWPPELVFTMDMIPALVQAGYEYVVVDGVHVRPEDGINDTFRPYIVYYEDVSISVVPLDRALSSAQETGLDYNWFQHEVRQRVSDSPRPEAPRLLTTWSDGENGYWFRRFDEASGFFGYFWVSYLEQCRAGEMIRPVKLSEYLAALRPLPRARIQTGTWNVGIAENIELAQWIGSEGQYQAVTEVQRLSARYWEVCRLYSEAQLNMVEAALAEVRRLILEAETSCFLFWGDAWLPYLYLRTKPAQQNLTEIETILQKKNIDKV